MNIKAMTTSELIDKMLQHQELYVETRDKKFRRIVLDIKMEITARSRPI